jgi:large repetitive protein
MNMKTLTRSTLLSLLSLITIALPRDVRADTPITLACPTFEGTQADLFKFQLDASRDSSDIRLTRDVAHISGTALSKNLIFLASDGSFSTYFTFKMTKRKNPEDSGGDGLAFILQTDLKSKLGVGANIGYAGANSSLAIEFDTFPNTDLGDPKKDHIGVNINGDPRSAATALSPFHLNDGRTYHVWAEFEGSSQTLEIRLADSATRPAKPILSLSLDPAPILGGAVHVGFSAATGAAHQEHTIQSLYFHREFVPGGLDAVKEFYVTDPAN